MRFVLEAIWEQRILFEEFLGIHPAFFRGNHAIELIIALTCESFIVSIIINILVTIELRIAKEGFAVCSRLHFVAPPGAVHKMHREHGQYS